MKKIHVLLGALALVAAFSCSKEKDVEVDNPNYNKETNEVKTDFVFNISTAASQTKMNSDATQALSTSGFRGIENAILLTYQEEAAGKILPADKSTDKLYDLSSVLTAGSLDNTNSRRVLELSLPLKTNTLLFYGKAPYGDPYGGFANIYDCYGHLDTYSIGKDAGSADIHIGKRLSDELYPKFVTVEKLFAGIMSMLLNTTLPSGTVISASASPAGVDTPYKFDVTLTGDIHWYDYANAEGKSPLSPTLDEYPLEYKLRHLYRQLTTINSSAHELRAGSGEAVLSMAKDLWAVLEEIRSADTICQEETVAKYFANEVHKRMEKYYTLSSGSLETLSFKEATQIAEAFFSAEEQATRPFTAATTDYEDGSYWPTTEQVTAIAAYKASEFPFNFNIPRGATHIAYNSTTKMFYYPQKFDVSSMGGTPGSGDTYNAQDYFYPAELIYFGNSPIRTSSADKSTSDYPNGAGTAAGQWDNDASWDADWAGNQVAAATRAVAMKYDINYGVAMLETKVKYAEGLNYLKDNNHAVQNAWAGGTLLATEELDQDVPITSTGFKVTGLIIGGQSHKIGWDNLPVKDGENYKYGFIYDKAIVTAAQAIPISGTSSPNYTLVFDNFHAASEAGGYYTAADTQDIVYVAVEFQNNTGMDFYGNGNLIKDGGYFYLIGALNPASAADITWPTTYVVPPYKSDGTSLKTKRVFIQDFVTSVTFTLGENSLHGAYLTVPDLRSSSMSLGLSVDLKWETGLVFENVPLG